MDSLKRNINTGIQHLISVDQNLELLVVKFGFPSLKPSINYFESLIRSIIFQQLSGKAAGTIYNRFLGIYADNKFPLPLQVVNTDIPQLRQVGLSNRKASYVIGLAGAFQNSNFLPKDLTMLSDEQISEKLIELRGVGQWTADMFLIFSLNRLDVLPLTDLGIQKGMKEYFNLKVLPSEKQMLKLSTKWKPYRSLASWYMWKIVDDGFQW